MNRDHEKLSRYRIIHFATHGLFAGELEGKGEEGGSTVSEAGLVFTPPKVPTREDDGLLTAPEITELKLKADWVILSACNTAGDKTGTEALSGLARAFFYAGARALLVSHWAVDSSAAVNLTTATFAKLKAGAISKARAFQQAMKELVDSPKPSGIALLAGGGIDKAHPAYWAPFDIVGDGR
jgi:CHAT domain-containing protein